MKILILSFNKIDDETLVPLLIDLLKTNDSLIDVSVRKDEKLNYLLNCNLEWKPDHHLHYSSKQFKKNVFAFVCCLKRIEEKLPFKFGKFVLFEMIKKIDRKSFFSFEFPGEQLQENKFDN